MIDRYHLRYFLAVIDQGNFSKAAIACNVSQPTLSVGIARLEATLGGLLFHRSSRRVELTDAGARLAAHARRIEGGFLEAERAVAGAGPTTVLRLGVLASTPAAWIESFLRGQRGGERVEIVEGRERDLADRLARGRLDCALTILREGQRGASDLFFTEGYALAMAAGHPLAGRAEIAAEELAGQPMILRRHCELLPQTSRHFTARGIRPFFPARTTSEARALGYVRAGLGVTVMPDCFVGPGIARPRLADFAFTRDIGLAYAPHQDADELRARPLVRSLAAAIERAREAARGA